MNKKEPGAVYGALDADGHSPPLTGAFSHRVADFVSLTKPRLNLLVVATAAVGYYIGAGDAANYTRLVEAVVGIALVAGGAAGLNQLYERDTDSIMWRTRSRPVAARRISTGEALVFSLALVALGLVLLAATSNLLATGLAFVTLVSYNLIYTPMKRRSELATLVGAVPGALPPAIGWVAARGTLSIEAATLFLIVFIWQIPHFMAIAWLYRADFERAGFPLLPVVEPAGLSTARQAVMFSLVLVPVSLAPYFLGMTGPAYAVGAAASGMGLLWIAVRFALQRSDDRARLLFLGSITYLPVLWAMLIADRI